MNSGQTSERVYDAIRYRIMTHEIRPGERLDPALLADTLSSSVTPVRDALHILTGEGLVETRTSGGFHVPSIDEPALVDLLAWAGQVSAITLRSWASTSQTAASDGAHRASKSYTDKAAAIFAGIAERSDNVEHRRAMTIINARLHAVRTVEPRVIGGVAEELEELSDAIERYDRARLRPLVNAYVRRRQRSAADLVRALYRLG